MGMALTALQRTGLGAATLSALALALAHGSERFGGLVPCALCLVERTPYWLALGLGVAAVVLPRMARLLVALAAVALLAGAGLGLVHVGVEQGWWPSPLPECSAPALSGGSFADRLARMPERPAKPCDAPTYLLPAVPLSMAAMNMLLASIIGAALAAAVLRPRSSP